MIKILLIAPIIFLYSCSNTSPTNVKTSDAQKVTAVEYGIIKSASPIKIKGEVCTNSIFALIHTHINNNTTVVAPCREGIFL